MAGKWEGFTEEDINNINNSKTSLSSCKALNSSSSVSKQIRKQNHYTKKNVTRERMLQGSKYYSNSKNTCEIPKEARLFIPQIPEEEEEEEIEKKLEPTNSLEKKINVDDNIGNTPVTENIKPSAHLPPFKTEPILCSGNVDTIALEEFEERQKRIKEQNRLRKEFLKKAIEDRTKKTHAEARRLHQIEGELKKLDDQLITDVAILRDQIETASLEFMEAQKRFDLSEKEYLDAKLALFNKKERKELLTSHLCTIIEHNEIRKAKKLSELMQKLEIGPSSNFLITPFLTTSAAAEESSQTVESNNHNMSTRKDEKCLAENEESKNT